MSPVTPPTSLATRLARRAIDLLVIGFLAVVGLSLGSQLIDWWRVDPPSVQPSPSIIAGADLDWSRSPVSMEFGDETTSIERTPFVGDTEKLDGQLTKLAESIVESSQLPRSPLIASEKGWLDALNAAPPVLTNSTQGNVYRRNDVLPSFVATRFVAPDDTQKDGLENDSAVTQRIVGWGLAFPSGPRQWVIYTFRPEAVRVVEVNVAPSVPLPETSRRLTEMSGQDGSRWLVFQGRGDVSGWVQHFDAIFDQHSNDWRVQDDHSASIQYRTAETAADLQLKRESDGSMTGVLWIGRQSR